MLIDKLQARHSCQCMGTADSVAASEHEVGRLLVHHPACAGAVQGTCKSTGRVGGCSSHA